MGTLQDSLILNLDSAYNLARWLTRNENDAREVVQEAFLRALKYSDSYKGPDTKSWFLKIIRNTTYTWLKKQKVSQVFIPYDEDLHGGENKAENPETEVLRKADRDLVHHALESIAVEYREVLILKELENLSYKEIAEIIDVPIGTVMSRLSRARDHLLKLIKSAETMRGL